MGYSRQITGRIKKNVASYLSFCHFVCESPLSKGGTTTRGDIYVTEPMLRPLVGQCRLGSTAEVVASTCERVGIARTLHRRLHVAARVVTTLSA